MNPDAWARLSDSTDVGNLGTKPSKMVDYLQGAIPVLSETLPEKE
jgi:uncharacterized protein YgbK (DUF1537 family)